MRFWSLPGKKIRNNWSYNTSLTPFPFTTLKCFTNINLLQTPGEGLFPCSLFYRWRNNAEVKCLSQDHIHSALQAPILVLLLVPLHHTDKVVIVPSVKWSAGNKMCNPSDIQLVYSCLHLKIPLLIISLQWEIWTTHDLHH